MLLTYSCAKFHISNEKKICNFTAHFTKVPYFVIFSNVYLSLVSFYVCLHIFSFGSDCL